MAVADLFELFTGMTVRANQFSVLDVIAQS